MTNPDNIVRVRARNGGRASVYEANGWAQAYTSGLIEGNGVKQNASADMNVLVGGSAAKPDVILAENPSGYKIALDLVGQQAIAVTAPASNKRISAIVAYTDDLSLSTTQDTVTGSPASCGLIVVNGTTSVSPSAPTDNQIRTAITADGATGSQAAYCVIATIEVANDTTIITDSLITMNQAGVRSQNIDFATIKYPFIGSRIESIGDINSTRSITFTQNCFLVGKACTFESGAAAFCRLNDDSGPFICGIPFMSDSTNAQIAFCVPIAAGQTVKFIVNHDAAFQSIATYEMVAI